MSLSTERTKDKKHMLLGSWSGSSSLPVKEGRWNLKWVSNSKQGLTESAAEERHLLLGVTKRTCSRHTEKRTLRTANGSHGRVSGELSSPNLGLVVWRKLGWVVGPQLSMSCSDFSTCWASPSAGLCWWETRACKAFILSWQAFVAG